MSEEGGRSLVRRERRAEKPRNKCPQPEPEPVAGARLRGIILLLFNEIKIKYIYISAV